MQRRTIWRRAFGLVGIISVAVAGCGGGDGATDIGQAADKANATRTLEIRQADALRFEPDVFEVKAGETVMLRVTNTGTLIHEFFLGDEKAHAARDKEMAGMGSEPMKMPDMANSLNIEPGATEEIAWTFPKKGTVRFGCHEPGHYDDGMKGTFNVT